MILGKRKDVKVVVRCDDGGETHGGGGVCVEAGEVGLDEGAEEVDGVGGDVVEVGVELGCYGGGKVSEGVAFVGIAEDIERALR